MNINNILDTAIRLSQRSELLDSENISIALYFANKTKLELQRNHKLRCSGNTLPIPITANMPSFVLPTRHLRPNVLYRSRATHDVGEDTLYYFIRKYISLEKFREHYPLENDSGDFNIGPIKDYIIYGDRLIFGPRSDRQETLYYDYDAALQDYEIDKHEEDEISEVAFDYLINGIIAEIYTSWTFDEKKAALWQALKVKTENQISVLCTSEEMSGISTRQVELFGEERVR